MATTQPYSWLKTIQEGLLELEERPQFGPQFGKNFDLQTWPKQELEKRLSEVWQRKVKIDQKPQGWVQPQEIASLLSNEQLICRYFLAPLATPFFVMAHKSDLRALCAALMGPKGALKEAELLFLKEAELHDFFRYTLIELGSHIQALWLNDYSLQLDLQTTSLPADEALFVVDVSIAIEGKNCLMKLLLPVSFRSGFKRSVALQHHAPPTLAQMQESSFELVVVAGHTTVTLGELKEIHSGDLLLIERAFIDPMSLRGRVEITMAGRAIFRGKIETEGIRLLSYPIYEEAKSMRENEHDEEYESLDDADERDSFEESDDEELFEESEEELQENAADEAPGVAERIQPEEVSVELTVELARLRINGAELLNLSVGDLLDLHLNLFEPVTLTANGKKVFRGELVKKEDLLFVRLLP